MHLFELARRLPHLSIAKSNVYMAMSTDEWAAKHVSSCAAFVSSFSLVLAGLMLGMVGDGIRVFYTRRGCFSMCVSMYVLRVLL